MAGAYQVQPVAFNSPSMVTATLGVNDGVVGSLLELSNNVYRLVYNAGNSQIVPGNGVTVSAVSGYSVTVSTTASALIAVGVCYHATITTGTYGYVLVDGFGVYKAAPNSIVAAGEGLAVGADGTWVVASGITGGMYGKAMTTTISAGVGGGYFSFY